MLKSILSISGKPGLFKLVSGAKNMLIVESLVDGKRFPSHQRDKVISLADIAMYTETTEVPLRAAAAKKIAEEFDLTFIPLQAGFDELEKTAPASFWLLDGVHPSAAGHQFIKQQWINAYKTI